MLYSLFFLVISKVMDLEESDVQVVAGLTWAFLYPEDEKKKKKSQSVKAKNCLCNCFGGRRCLTTWLGSYCWYFPSASEPRT